MPDMRVQRTLILARLALGPAVRLVLVSPRGTGLRGALPGPTPGRGVR